MRFLVRIERDRAAATPAMSLGRTEIMATIPHRPPFLFVDAVENLAPGRFGTGVMTIPHEDAFLQGLFPGRFIMPGTLVVEAMAQTAIVVAATALERGGGVSVALRSIAGVRFRRPVVAGETVHMHCRWDGRRGAVWRASVSSYVGDTEAVSASFTALLAAGPDSAADQG